MPQATKSKVWLITGASKGFGYVWTEAALERGDSVAASARTRGDLDTLKAKYGDRLLIQKLDVGDKSAVDKSVKEAHDAFGRIDIAINNAGYGLFGGIEEVSEDEARAQIETNLFGALWVTKAVIPIMRTQRSGHIIQISSIGGVMAFPLIGLYHASKWGLEGFSQSLAAEVKGFGINVTIVEPSGFATEWGTTSAHRAKEMPAYDDVRAGLASFRAGYQPGDPKATGAAMLRVVDAETPPLRVIFGSNRIAMFRNEYENRLATWEKWSDVSEMAQGNLAAAKKP